MLLVLEYCVEALEVGVVHVEPDLVGASDWEWHPQNDPSLVARCYLVCLVADLGVAAVVASVGLDRSKLLAVYLEQPRHSCSSAPCFWSPPPLVLVLAPAVWAFAQGTLETGCLAAWPWDVQGSKGSDRAPVVSGLPLDFAEGVAAAHFHVPGLGEIGRRRDLQACSWGPVAAVVEIAAGALHATAHGHGGGVAPVVVVFGLVLVLVLALVPALEAVEPVSHSQAHPDGDPVAGHGPMRRAVRSKRCAIAHSLLGHSHCRNSVGRSGCLGPDAAVAGVHGVAGVLPGVRAVLDTHHSRHSLGIRRSLHNSAGAVVHIARVGVEAAPAGLAVPAIARSAAAGATADSCRIAGDGPLSRRCRRKPPEAVWRSRG